MPVDGYGPLLLVLVAALLSVFAGAMSRGGAGAGLLVGGLVALGLGWRGFAMLATLLVVGTIASAPARRGRGAFQALCNGAVAAGAALLAGAGVAWAGAAAAGALATALSDTVAGEWGQRYGGEPRLLLLGGRVARGTDGGMTWAGTGAGLVAAFLVPAAGAGVGALSGVGFDTNLVVAIAAAGFVGNLCDSLCGWLLQPKLGVRGNDWTNLIATGCGATLAALA